MALLLSIALAVLAALAFAAATVGQQHEAAASPVGRTRGLPFMLALLRNPRWIAATLGNGVGYGLQAAALGVGSVVVVQPILVTSLLFALPLGARIARQALPAESVIAGVLLTTSLAVFVMVGGAAGGLAHVAVTDWLVVAAIGTPVVLGCLLLAHRRVGALRAGLLAVVVGVLGGVLAVLTKSVVDNGSGGLGALLGSGETYALVTVGLAGTFLQQLSFQAGALAASLPIMTVLEPLVAAVLGMTVLDEQLDAGGFRAAILGAAALTMTVATVVLARGQSRSMSAGNGVVSEEPRLSRTPATMSASPSTFSELP